jgi:CelD/BcsL family acetyltransferase involved in cellulose biosynthesis
MASVPVIIQTPRIGEHASAWDRLVDGDASLSVFERSWWLDAVAGADGSFLLVQDETGLIGGLALAHERARGVERLTLVGAGIPHGLDAVAAPGREDDVVAALAEWLDRRGNRRVQLVGLRAESLMARASPQGARLHEIERAPYLRVPPTFEEYVAARPRKLRQELRRVIRRLEEQGLRDRLVDPADTERALETFLALHRLRWDDESLFLDSLERFERAVGAGAPSGRIRFHEVVADEQVIASLVTIEEGTTCAFHQMGRDPAPQWSNSGTYLKARALDRACREQFEIVDLCYGEAPGKMDWADDARPVFSLAWAHGAIARGVDAAQRTVAVTRRRSA